MKIINLNFKSKYLYFSIFLKLQVFVNFSHFIKSMKIYKLSKISCFFTFIDPVFRPEIDIRRFGISGVDLGVKNRAQNSL